MNSLNSRTPTKKLLDKFRKVNGYDKSRTIPPLQRAGDIITSPEEIVDSFSDHYAKISKDPIRKVNQGKTEIGRRKRSYQ